MNHTCLCLPSRSWYSLTDPGGIEAQGQYWAGRTPRPNNGTPNMASAPRLCPELFAILDGDLIRGYMI